MFSILLLDPTGEKLQHRFSQRFEERHALEARHSYGPRSCGICGEAKEAVLVPDVAKSTLYIAVNPETRSELAVPLIYQEKVIGVLDLEHTRRGLFHRGSQARPDYAGSATGDRHRECAAV